MKIWILGLLLFLSTNLFAQTTDTTELKVYREIASQCCQCIDSVSTYNRSKDAVNTDVSNCIRKKVTALQLTLQLVKLNLDDVAGKKGKKKKSININLSEDPNSPTYKEYYFKLETYLMQNCPALKSKIAANNKTSDHSYSENPEALRLYKLGQEQDEIKNYPRAIELYDAALKVDSMFAFAWDNKGLCHRKIGEYEKALKAYQKSIEVEPNGLLPRQNIAIVYEYMKDYPKSIEAYRNLAKLDPQNPEVYYGLGHIYSNYMFDYENGLDNFCKAYNLYTKTQSPYRADAEHGIQVIYAEMKKQGNLKTFNRIMKENNINVKD